MPLLTRVKQSLDPGVTLDLYPSGAATRKRADHLVCGNPGCNSGWLRYLRSRSDPRPIFEDRWGCSPRCVKSLIEDATRRESRGADVPGSPHRHRVPLGLVLLANGLITHPQLQHALAMQRKAGAGKIGAWLVDEFGLAEHCVTRALSLQWSCPVLSVERFDAPTMALCMPRVLVESLRLLPLRIASSNLLYLGFEDRMDASAALAVERMLGMKVESGLVDGTHFAALQQRLFLSDFIAAKSEQVRDLGMLSDRIAATTGRVKPLASRLVRVHGFFWLRMWLESGAMRTPQGGVPVSTEDVQDCLYTLVR